MHGYTNMGDHILIKISDNVGSSSFEGIVTENENGVITFILPRQDQTKRGNEEYKIMIAGVPKAEEAKPYGRDPAWEEHWKDLGEKIERHRIQQRADREFYEEKKEELKNFIEPIECWHKGKLYRVDEDGQGFSVIKNPEPTCSCPWEGWLNRGNPHKDDCPWPKWSKGRE